MIIGRAVGRVGRLAVRGGRRLGHCGIGVVVGK